MDVSEFNRLLTTYPVARPRSWVSKRPRAVAVDAAPAGAAAASTAGSAKPAAEPAAAIAGHDLWEMLDALGSTLALTAAQKKRFVRAFEDLHGRLVRDSNLDDLDDLAAMVLALGESSADSTKR